MKEREQKYLFDSELQREWIYN